MDESVVRRLLDLNAAFYERFAAVFAASRTGPQPGYERLLAYLSAGPAAVLDVGCGNGRFARFLAARGRAPGLTVAYTGVDGSAALLAAAVDLPARLMQRDLSRSGSLDDLEQFDLVVCLSTLQHIPGWANRARLLAELGDRLGPGGHLALANWQFLDSPRQRRKVRPWAEIGLSDSDVEAGDALVAWQRGGYGLRYVAHIDAAATRELAAEVGLRVVEQYRSDGRETDLNLYTILAG